MSDTQLIRRRRFTPIYRPSNSIMLFITIIVKAPVVPILSMLLALTMVALEFPAPFMKGTAIHRSIVVRIVALLLQSFMAILWYQVRFLPSFPILFRLIVIILREQMGLYGHL